MLAKIRHRIGHRFCLMDLVLTAGLSACDGGEVRRIPDSVPSNVATAIQEIQSENVQRMLCALDALSTMGTNAAPAVPFLIERLDDERVYNVFGGATIGDRVGAVFMNIGKVAVAPLSEILGSTENPRVKDRVVAALTMINDISATPAILGAIRTESDGEKRALFVRCLERLTKQKLGEDVSVWEDWWRNRAKSEASGFDTRQLPTANTLATSPE